MFAHAEALIQSADSETWQTTSIMASELIGKGKRWGEAGGEVCRGVGGGRFGWEVRGGGGGLQNESTISSIFHRLLFVITHHVHLSHF